MIRINHKYLKDGTLAFSIEKTKKFHPISAQGKKEIIYTDDEFLAQIEVLERLIKSNNLELSLVYSETPDPLKTMEFIKKESLIIYNDIVANTEQLNDLIENTSHNNEEEKSISESTEKHHNPYKVQIISGIVVVLITSFIIAPSRNYILSCFSNNGNKQISGKESVSSNLLGKDISDNKVLGSLSLFVKYNLSKSDKDNFIKEFREKDNVSELSTLESGKPAKELPDGIYSFVYPVIISTRKNNLRESLLKVSTLRFKSYEDEFEVHFINKEEIILLGFVSEKDASDISYLTGNDSHSIVLSPLLFNGFKSFVAIPIDRIVSSRDRAIEISEGKPLYILDIKVK